jgi:16S rRNA G966 N2-methylase RsmD
MLAKGADAEFDYIYIAPPQYKDMWEKALELVDDNINWLSQDSWVIIQIAPKEYREIPLANLQEIEQRKYGTSLLVFFERNEQKEST